MSITQSDYEQAIEICEDWLASYSSSHECGGQHLIDTLENVAYCKQPRSYLIDTRPFGSLLSKITGDEIVLLMKVLMAHIQNPNFTLTCGFYKGKTLLQGAIETGNKELVSMLISNTHGSKLNCGTVEPMIMDYKLLEWFLGEHARVEEATLSNAIVV